MKSKIAGNTSKQTSNACFFGLIWVWCFILNQWYHFFPIQRGEISHHSLWCWTNQRPQRPVHGLRCVSRWEIHPQNKAISGRSHTWSQFSELNQFKMNSLCLPNWKRGVRRYSPCESRIRWIFLGYFTKQTPVPASDYPSYIKPVEMVSCFFKLGCSTEEFRSDILAVFLLSCLHCFKFVYSKAKSVKCNQTELILKFCTAVLLLYPSIRLISLSIKNIFFTFYLSLLIWL